MQLIFAHRQLFIFYFLFFVFFTVIFFFSFTSRVHALRIQCTEQAFHNEIARLNACGNNAADYNKAGCDLPGRVITFNCANTTIYLKDWFNTGSSIGVCNNPSRCTGSPNARRIKANDVVIDGENKITFKSTPSCNVWVETQSSPGLCVCNGKPGCTTGATCIEDKDCGANSVAAPYGSPYCNVDDRNTNTDYEQGSFFVDAYGNAVNEAQRITVKNIILTHFLKTITANKYSGFMTVDNVKFIRTCDTAFGDYGGSGGVLFNYGGHVMRNSEVRRSTDKSLQFLVTRKDLSTNPSDLNYYNIHLENNLIYGFGTHVSFGGGRYRVINNVFETDPATASSFGPKLGAGGILYFIDNEVKNLRLGLQIMGEAFVDGNTFRDGDRTGAYVCDNGKAVFQKNIFQNNGGGGPNNLCAKLADGSMQPLFGGVAVGGSGVADLGGGSVTIDGRSYSSIGQNSFLGNKAPGDSTRDITHLSGIVTAKNNWWGVNANPTDKISGSVDFSNWLPQAPGSGGDTGPPSPPRGVKIQ